MKIRALLLTLAVMLVLPAIAYAQNVNISSRDADQFILNINESLSVADRKVGLSSASVRDRAELYKRLDSVAAHSQNVFSLIEAVPKNRNAYVVDKKKYTDGLNAALRDINGLQKQYNSIRKLPHAEVVDFETSISQLSANLQGMAILAQAPSHAKPTPPRPLPNRPSYGKGDGNKGKHEVVYVAMNHAEFNDLIARLKRESSDNQKAKLLGDVLAHNYITSEQAVSIINAFTFKSGKKDATKILYSRTINPENWWKVFGAYTFDSERKESLEAIAGINPPVRNMRIQLMDPNDFASLITLLKKINSGDGIQYALKSSLNYLYFDVNQVIEITKIASFARHKVDIAVLLYPRTVGAKDWYKIYDVFSFDSDKDKLRNAIKNLTPASQ